MRRLAWMFLMLWGCSPAPNKSFERSPTLTVTAGGRVSVHTPVQLAFEVVLPPSGSDPSTVPVQPTAMRAATLGNCTAELTSGWGAVEVRATGPGACLVDVFAETEAGLVRGTTSVEFVDVPAMVPSDEDLSRCSDTSFVEVGPYVACDAPGLQGLVAFGPGHELAIGGGLMASLDEDHLLVRQNGSLLAVDASGLEVGRLDPDGSFSAWLVQRHHARPRLVLGGEQGISVWTWTGAGFEREPTAFESPPWNGAVVGDLMLNPQTGEIRRLADDSLVGVTAVQPSSGWLDSTGAALLVGPSPVQVMWTAEHLVAWKGVVLGDGWMPPNSITGVGRTVVSRTLERGFQLEVIDVSRGEPRTVAIGDFPGGRPPVNVTVGYRHVRFVRDAYEW